MEIKYQFFKNDYLLIQKFIGSFSVEEYSIYNGYITKQLSSNSIRKVLIDFRDLMFLENDGKIPDDFYNKIDKIIEIRRSINQNEKSNKEVTLVILVDNPRPTVIAHLFVKFFSGMNYHYCSTSSKAIDILKIPGFKNKLESVVMNLENTFDIKSLSI